MSAHFTLEGLFHPTKQIKYFDQPRTELEWLPDGKLLEKQKGENGVTFVKRDPLTWQEETLISSRDISEMVQGTQKDGEVVKTFTDFNPVWNKSYTAFLLEVEDNFIFVDVVAKRAQQLTHDTVAKHAPSFSPDGQHVAFIRNYDLYKVSILDGEETQLTQAGNQTRWNGCFERQQEVDGVYWWSPDSEHIYYVARDMSLITPTPVVNYFDNPASVSWDYSVQYTTSPQWPESKIGVVDIAGQTRWLETPHPDLETFVEDVIFDKQGNPVVVWAGRGNRWLEVHRYAGTQATLLVRENEGAWQNSRRSPVFLRDNSFLWQSDHTGYRHIYHYDADGKRLAPVTQGEWMVQGIHGVDEKTERVFFDARGEHRHITVDSYSVHLDGTNLTRLTKERGQHHVWWNQDFTHYLDRWSSVEHPPVQGLFDAKGKELKRIDETPLEQIKALNFGRVTFQQVPARDGFPLETMLMLPPDFDPEKKYPVYQYIYGFSSNDNYGCPEVIDAWQGVWQLFHRFLTQQGYVVWIADSRASSGKSASLAWSYYKRIAAAELEDQPDALAWLAKQPWADMNRVALHGWSTGGYMTTMLMCKTKRYKIGLPGGVFDFPLAANDDMTMNERWHEGYERDSTLKALPDLHGKLLLIHGTSDINTPVHNVMRYADVLERSEKDYELHLVPGMTHGPQTPWQDWAVFRKMWHFVRDNL
jgi:dipeptidyl-peptidase 4